MILLKIKFVSGDQLTYEFYIIYMFHEVYNFMKGGSNALSYMEKYTLTNGIAYLLKLKKEMLFLSGGLY